MNKKLLNIILISGIMLSTLSCDDPDPSRTELLTNKKWAITNIISNNIDTTDDELEDCDSDDYIVFNKNGTFTDPVGTALCYEGEEDASGTWEWKENEKILSIDYSDDDANDWEVIEIKSSRIRLKHYFEDTQVTNIVTMTIKK